jgi:hypothetical protein
MFKEIANGAKIQVLPIIPIYAKVSKRIFYAEVSFIKKIVGG